MSTLKANNVQHLDSSSASIQTTQGGGTILTGVSTIGNANLVVESNASEGVRIDSSGNVGIGTDDPSKTLSILSSQSVMLQLESTSNTARIGFIVPNQNNSPTIGVSDLDELQFRVGGSERVRITSAGLVGIGLTNPETVRGNNVLEVAGTTGGEVIASRNDTSVNDDDFIGGFVFKNRDAGGDPNHFAGMYAKANGTAGSMDLHFSCDRTRYESDISDLTIRNSNVGIGTTNPQNALHVDAIGTQATFNSTNANTYKIALQNVGVTTSWIGGAQTGDIFTIADSSVTSRFALTDNGTIHDTDGCAAEAVPPGTQSTAAASAVNIQLSSATGNLGNGITFNNASDRFDITEAGVYMIHAIVEIQSAAARAASTFSAGILKSGLSIAVNSYLHEGFTGGFTETFYCSTIEELANGENISMTYTQNTTTSATITSNSRLLVTRIA